MKIAGLDIGTSGCKCTVFDDTGKFLDKAYRDYPVKRTTQGHEIDVTVVMDGVYAVISEMAEKYEDIVGLGVTSFGEAFAMVDDNGTPLHIAMLYTDPRGAKECEYLKEKLGDKHIAEITGLHPHEMYSISKIMWIKNNHPEIYNAAKKILLVEDYVVYHLTGRAQIDYSLAARTMAFDIRELTWSREIFEAAGIDMTKMSKPVPTGTSAGVITEAVSRKTGLSLHTQVISICHDQMAAAVGAGAFDGTVAVDGAGTVECLTPIYDKLPNISVMYDGFFSVVPYVIPGKYVAYAFSYTGGALISWVLDNIAQGEKEQAKKAGISVNSWLEKQSESPTGLLVLPHFAGAATPYMDNGSKGAIIGLMMDSSAADIYRGCMEGVVYEMYLNMEKLKESGIHFTKLLATGGGANSVEWMQMKADVMNMPITALKIVDAGTVGSAMITGVVMGLFENLEDAAGHMVEIIKTYEPRADIHEKYMRLYEKYKRLYEAVRPLV